MKHSINQKRMEDRIFFAAALCLLAVFGALNFATYYCVDDYSYMFNFVTKNRIMSIADIFQSLSIHYTNVNGRMITHFFAHLFLYMGKSVFNIINTVAFAMLCFVMCLHICKRFVPKYFFMVICGLILLTPDFGQSFLWVTGASNYLYGPLIVLVYMLPLRACFEDGDISSAALKTVLFGLAGIIAGWTLENLSVALCFFLIVAILFRIVKKQRIPFFAIAGLLGSIAGLLLMILAPGELHRLGNSGGFQALILIFSRIVPITARFVYYLWPVLLPDIIMLAVFIRKFGIREWQRLLPAAVFFLTALASIYSMAASPQFPTRVWSGSVCFILISSGMLYRVLEVKAASWLKYGVFVVFAAVVMTVSLNGLGNVQNTNRAFVEREAEARAVISEGNDEIILKNVKGSGSRFDAQPTDGDITADKNYWTNVALARYFGIYSVCTE